MVSDPPNFVNEGEMLTLVKRQLHKIEFHGEHLKAPKMVLLNFHKMFNLYMIIS